MSLLQADQGIHGNYLVERFLGEGAFAEVYRVRHRFLGRQAMKVFKGAGMTPAEIETVLEEARLLSQLGHPNIVRVFEANTLETSRGECGFFTMEFVAGGSVERFWASHGPRFVPAGTTVEILSQACRGLSVAHGESPPIAHRDIKPQNLLVGYDANGLRVRVSDFGLARRIDAVDLTASVRGTAAYKAPETFLDPLSDSCAGDVWALGTVAYLLLTDHLPYGQVSERDLVKGAVFERPVTLPSRLNIDVDHHLDRIVLTALAPNPGDRYADAAEMLADLDEWGAASRHAGTSPAPAVTSKERFSPDAPSMDEARAAQLVDQALGLARQAATLADAADVMEEALNKAPGLRARYAARVRLWRNGIVQ